MKVTIITVVYNGEKYIKDCIESVLDQNYEDIEYIIVDGASTDKTCSIIEDYQAKIHRYISEKDKGMYDGLNKGIALATGDIIGILNADDMLASNTVITNIVTFFKVNGAEGVYGNLNYVNASNPNQIIRKWISRQYTKRAIELGWMPAHPTLYLKRELFKKHGNYSLDFGTAADYELMIRFLYKYNVRALFINELIVNMRVGGMSNSSLNQRYLAMKYDFKAAKKNKLPFALLTIVLKKISKVSQFLHRN
ncbi:glycosyltransferase [Pedobacter polaris]|uniref:Glycosyltransferase n=1 Tax=Pedobacter polaris TaxID=2571273 RepID=A0A4U1CM96_9SPHI|nr:glycosyltransferase family 2 protein [Pedobacter polaris]TKC08199.1 glycosyltransferase [Pedobacter polaris]